MAPRADRHGRPARAWCGCGRAAPRRWIGRPTVTAVLLLLLETWTSAAWAQSSADRILARVRTQAAAGDTAGAVSTLEAALSPLGEDPALLAELGWLQAIHASSQPTEFRERASAERDATRAWKLEPDAVRPLVTLAEVRLKQGRYGESMRMLDRAASKPGFSSTEPELRAEWHYVEGRVLERHVRDFDGLVRRPDGLEVSTPGCNAIGLFCEDFSHPIQFNEMLAGEPSLEGLVSDERARMIEAFRSAAELDVTHTRALSRLLLALVDGKAWGEYLRYARRGVAANPKSALAHLWLGLGLHRTGAEVRAQWEFESGLALLPKPERSRYTDPRVLETAEDSARTTELMQRDGRAEVERVLWARSDPLYLTGSNERWVEHLARVTYADLKFAPEAKGFPGSETDAGRIYVRYGPPRAIWSVVRDRTKEVDPERQARILAAIDALCLKEQCLRGAGYTTPQGGGRYIFWNYAPDRPSLVFTRDQGLSNLEFMPDAYSERYAQEVRARLPSIYEPFPRKLDLPHQIARFKGGAPDTTVVETYGALPLAGLTGSAEDSVQVGSFFFDAGHTESYRWTGTVRAGGRDTVPLGLKTKLPLGYYDYSLEAYDPRREAVARARGSLVTRRYALDTLSLSDVLVADRIDPRREDLPADTRKDLKIQGSADLAFGAGEPVGLYWETYGLTTEGGVARYRVTIEVRDAEDHSLPVRVLSAIAGVFGGGQPRPRLSWTREVDLAERDRAIDWIVLRDLSPGEGRVVVTVHDLVAGTAATAERYLSVGHDE